MTADVDEVTAAERDLNRMYNTARITGMFDPGSPEWHAVRAAGIGGSEVAPILGLSPWQSPYSLWHAKRHGWTLDPNPEMEWGTAIEPALLDWWFRENEAYRPHTPHGLTWAHQRRPWQRMSPDGIAVSDDDVVLVEAKKGDYDQWGEPGTDQVPVHYRVQVVHGMDVLGLRRASFVVSLGGRAPLIYWVDYDPEEARLIRGQCAAFWRSLQHGVAPDLDGHSATYQAVRRLHPAIDGTDVVIDDHVGAMWHEMRAELARVEDIDRYWTAELLTAMGQARRAVFSDGTPVARRQPARGGSVALYNLAPKVTR